MQGSGALSLDGNADYCAIKTLHYKAPVSKITISAWIQTTQTDAVIISFDRSELWEGEKFRKHVFRKCVT